MENIFIEIMSTVLIAVLPVLATLLTAYAKKGADALIKKVENEHLKDLLTDGFEVITDSVDYVQQTYVDALKAEGNFTVEAQTEALQKATEHAILLMSSEVQGAITENYGDLATYITTVIESKIKNS